LFLGAVPHLPNENLHIPFPYPDDASKSSKITRVLYCHSRSKLSPASSESRNNFVQQLL
jgi:hypothetical protein